MFEELMTLLTCSAKIDRKKRNRNSSNQKIRQIVLGCVPLYIELPRSLDRHRRAGNKSDFA